MRYEIDGNAGYFMGKEKSAVGRESYHDCHPAIMHSDPQVWPDFHERLYFVTVNGLQYAVMGYSQADAERQVMDALRRRSFFPLTFLPPEWQ
jgi:hypothetical protein